MCFYLPFLEVSLPSYNTHHFDHHTAARRLCRCLIFPPRNYAAETTSRQGPAGVAVDPSSKENLIFLSISLSLSLGFLFSHLFLLPPSSHLASWLNLHVLYFML